MNVSNIYARYKNKIEDNKIFDPIRQKYVHLTPEETVRQKTIKFLMKRLHVPADCIIVERSLGILGVEGSKKRIDIGILDDTGLIMAVVECKYSLLGSGKAAYVQAQDYLNELNTRYFFVTDGLQFDGYYYDTTQFIALAEIPTYDQWYHYPTL